MKISNSNPCMTLPLQLHLLPYFPKFISPIFLLVINLRNIFFSLKIRLSDISLRNFPIFGSTVTGNTVSTTCDDAHNLAP